MPRITVYCIQCQQPIETWRPERTKFCSKACKHEYQRNKMEVRCSYCGKPKRIVPSKTNSRFYFCDKSCESQYKQGRQNKVTVHCAYCGKPKEIYPSRVAEENYCNPACYHAHQREIQNGTITLTCRICGREYQTSRFFAEQRNSRYCSNRCRYKALAIDRVGKGNPMWITNKKTPVFYGENWRNIAASIRKRDKYTCQYCGKKHKGNGKTKALPVHHIKPLREFNGNYDQANNPQNLITLCVRCHALAERGRIPIQPKLL